MLASTMDVDKYIYKVLKRDMTPKELYSVIVNDVRQFMQTTQMKS